MSEFKPEIINKDGGGSSGGGFRLPPKLVALLIPLALLLVVAGLISRSCFTYIEPGDFAIKGVKIGVKKGFKSKVYEAGYAFRIPFGFEQMYRFSRNVQVLELTNNDSGANALHQFDRPAKIQTSDGYYVDVDVTIIYRIEDPYKIITSLGPGTQYLEMGLSPKAEPVLKQAFGELTTEDFYNSPLRVQKSEKARDLLNAELGEMGLRVDHVLVRYFKYSEEIQENIEKKKLQDQLVFKNQSEGRAAIEKANIMRVRQEGEANVSVVEEEGKAYQVTMKAKTDLYTRKKEAEADLLVQLAEARRTELKNEAMQVMGSDRAVAMKMAEVIRGLDSILIPVGGENGMNPLDLNQMLELFDVDQDDKVQSKARKKAKVRPQAVSQPVMKEEVAQ